MKQLVIGCLLGIAITVLLYKPNVVAPTDMKSNILITAAHLDNVAGYKLLYKDEDRDVAYYLDEQLDLTTLTTGGVTIEGLPDCKIIEASPGRFTVETSRPDLICNGLSGTRVKSLTGEEIGFVSQMKEGGKLECKTLQ